MESPDIDLWDVVAPSDPLQTINCKTDMDGLKDMHPSLDQRQSETSNSLPAVSWMSGCSGRSTAKTQNQATTHDQMQVEHVMPFLTFPEEYFHSLLEDNIKETGPPQVTKAPKIIKAATRQKKNPKLTMSDRDGAKISLPPCNVCGAKSSGFHFGVITCESCKVFFRRSLAKDEPPICHRKESCKILPGNRSDCPFCRLRKCQQVGMSKGGIKKGRYSFERRQYCQKLVDKLETEEQERPDTEKRHNKDLRRIEETIDRLKNLHDRHRLLTPEVLQNVRIAQQKKREHLKAMEEALGQTKPISPDDAFEFFKETGIDITGYAEMAQKCSVKCTPRYCVAVIQYLKEMEEYMSLGEKDRSAILKGGFNDWSWISHIGVPSNPDFMMTCIFCGVCFMPEELNLCKTKEEVLQFLRPAVILANLKLSDLEIAILRAFVFFDTNKCTELEEPEKVSQIQNHFLDCLLHALKENQGASKAMKSFAHIVHAFTELRRGKKDETIVGEKCIDIFSGEVKYPKIVAEVFDLPDCVVELERDFSNLQLQL